MQHIVDRRLAGKNKSIGNRERFLRRHKEQIREAVTVSYTHLTLPTSDLV